MEFWFNFVIFLSLLIVLPLNYFRFPPHQIYYSLLVLVSITTTIPVIISALKAIIKRHATVDLLASVALILSLWHQEWQSAAFINLMIVSARIFGIYTENRAKNAINKLLKLRPETIKIKTGSHVDTVHIHKAKVGQTCLIESGDYVPVDGQVIEGTAAIDQSALTGESLPLTKKPGDQVFTSTLNLSGTILVKIAKVGADTTFEKIIALMENAQAQKTGVRSLVDKFTSAYILITFLAASLIYFITRDLTVVLSLLLVTCADDIAVAVPMAFWATIAKAARQGIIVKNSLALENLVKMKTLIVDKTGTLTQGKIQVDGILPLSHKYSAKQILSFASSASEISEHPISKAIQAHAHSLNIKTPLPSKFEEIPGLGTVVIVRGQKIIVGNLTHLGHQKVHLTTAIHLKIDKYQQTHPHVVFVALNHQLIGLISLSDQLRPGIRLTLQKLHTLGVNKIIMLTGDGPVAAANIAKEVGIDEYHPNYLPQDKLEYIRLHQNTLGTIGMIGDGVNDSAAITSADVGISMGAIGSDAAIEASDIALMHDDFSTLPRLLHLSHFTTNVVRQNFLIWGVVNTLGLVLVFTHILTPTLAASYNFLTDFLPLINSTRVFLYRHDRL